MVDKVKREFIVEKQFKAKARSTTETLDQLLVWCNTKSNNWIEELKISKGINPLVKEQI
jgi:hypothetical protein